MTPRHEHESLTEYVLRWLEYQEKPASAKEADDWEPWEDTLMTYTYAPGFPGCPIHSHTTDGCDYCVACLEAVTKCNCYKAWRTMHLPDCPLYIKHSCDRTEEGRLLEPCEACAREKYSQS